MYLLVNYYKLIIINAQNENHKKQEFVDRRYKKEAHVLAEQPSSHYDNNDYRSPVSGEQEDAMYYNLTIEWRKGKTVKFEKASMAVTLRLPSSGM